MPYKILSKVVNRLKSLMHLLVAKNQTNFVGGRFITNNIIIAQEAIHSMHIKTGKLGWMPITIDMERGYDRLRWGFIKDTFELAKISANLGLLIMKCVTSSLMQVL